MEFLDKYLCVPIEVIPYFRRLKEEKKMKSINAFKIQITTLVTAYDAKLKKKNSELDDVIKGIQNVGKITPANRPYVRELVRNKMKKQTELKQMEIKYQNLLLIQERQEDQQLEAATLKTLNHFVNLPDTKNIQKLQDEASESVSNIQEVIDEANEVSRILGSNISDNSNEPMDDDDIDKELDAIMNLPPTEETNYSSFKNLKIPANLLKPEEDTNNNNSENQNKIIKSKKDLTDPKNA